MNDLATTLSALPATLALRGSAILMTGLVLGWLVSRSPAGARHRLRVSILVALLVLPLAAALAPPFELPILPARDRAAAASGPQVRTVRSIRTVTRTTPGQDGEPVVVTAPPGPTPARGGVSAGRGLGSPLLWIYALGVLSSLLHLTAGVLKAAKLTRDAHPLAPGNSDGWPLESTKRAELRLSPVLSTPLTWGVYRPIILLPADTTGWTQLQRRRALQHELAHVDRRDWAYQMLAGVVCSLYWFHPLVWIAARQLRLDAERAADDRVLMAGNDGCEYAEQLVALTRTVQRAARLPGLALAQQHGLQTRIDAILDPKTRRRTMTRKARLLAAGASLVALIAAGSLTLTHAAGSGSPSAMLVAAEEGDLAGLQSLLAAGAHPDESIEGHGTPLIQAAAAGHLEIVATLLAQGADVNQQGVVSGRGHLRRTALATASRHGHVEVVRALLEAGARVDRVVSGDGTALIEAARRGHPEIVALLLDRGADPGREVRGDGSPLIAATSAGDLKSVVRLIAAGADPSAWVTGDECPLYHAVRRGDAELVRVLLAAGADASDIWPGDGNPLIVAANSGNEAAVEALLAVGVDIDRGVTGDGTALIKAAQRGHLDIVERLIAAGADVDKSVRGDGNPLIAAARTGRLEIVRLLVESGANIDRPVPGDENPLIQAAAAGHLEVVRYLVDEGADVNKEVRANGRELRTPLNQAQRHGHPEVVAYLLERGARG